MTNPRPVLVLFPGAWGNRTQELATWWFRHVISHFKRNYQIVVVTYDGKSLNQFVASALVQLRDVPDDSFALCYSMGAQIARGVAAKRPQLFRRVALFSGLERGGVRFIVFLRALTFMLIPMLRTLMCKPLKLDTVEQVKRVFLRPLGLQGFERPTLNQTLAERDKLAQELLEHRLVPEPAWPMLQLFLPGLRQRMPAFPYPIMAIVPREDFILPRATYAAEHVQTVNASGSHALLIDGNGPISGYLSRISNWFLLN